MLVQNTTDLFAKEDVGVSGGQTLKTLATYRSARINPSTKVLLGGDGSVGENWNGERLSGADGGVTGDTWTWISPSQTGWLWHGDASVGDLPSDEADELVTVSVVVDRAESPVRMARTSSPWSMLRRRSNATFRISTVPFHSRVHKFYQEKWNRVGLTDPTAQCLEIPLLWPPSQAVGVDFAEDAGLDAGPAMRALSVACASDFPRQHRWLTELWLSDLHRSLRFRHSSQADPGSCLDWPDDATPWLLPVRLEAAM